MPDIFAPGVNTPFLRALLPKKKRQVGKRDSQRSKLYAAENSLPEMHAKDLGKDVSVEEMQRFVTKVCTSKRARNAVKKAGGMVTMVTATHSRGRRGAMAFGYYRIEVAGYMRSRMVILHELAHCFAPALERHGPRYAKIYLALVQAVMGRDVAKRLRAAFREHRVRTRVRKTRITAKPPMTTEQRVELLARLTRAREVARLNKAARLAAKAAH